MTGFGRKHKGQLMTGYRDGNLITHGRMKKVKGKSVDENVLENLGIDVL